MQIKHSILKATAWLLLICFLASTFLVGCDRPDGDETDSTQELGPIIETVRVTVPIGVGDLYHQYAKDLEGILQAHGYTVELGDDYLKSGESADPSAYEIYIGSVARDEMTAFLAEIGDFGWGIKQSGNKLCIAGTCDEFVKYAMATVEASMFANRHDPFGGVTETVHQYNDLLYLFRDGAANVTITGDTSDSDVKNAVDSLTASLKRLTGVSSLGGTIKIEIKKDVATEHAAFNALAVVPHENKIVLSAVESEGFEQIAVRFYDMLRKMNDWKNTKNLAWPEELVCHLALDAGLPYVPYHAKAVIDRGNLSNSFTVAIDSLSFAEFEAYVKKIEDMGYTRDYTYGTEYQYDSSFDTVNTSKDTHKNTFYTYVGDSGVIHVYHIGGTGHVRVVGISAEEYALSKEAMNDSSEGSNDSQFILLDIGGRNQTNNADLETYANGMCIVFRLSDGRFIVFDGGHTQSADPDSLEVTRLHKELVKRAPGGKVVIAAWIFTHMHGDHTTVAWKYESMYGREAEIQRYIYNMPSLEYALSIPGTDLSESYYGGMIYPRMTALFKRYDCVIARTGMVFNIGNATIEVMHTADDYFPTPLKIFNNSSLVTKVTIEGKSFLLAGDLQEDGQAKCVAQNGNLLNVNYIQATHHGYNMLMRFYQYSMAGELEGGRYAIWPRNKGATMINGSSSTETGRTINWLQSKVGFANNYYAFNGVQEVKLG